MKVRFKSILTVCIFLFLYTAFADDEEFYQNNTAGQMEKMNSDVQDEINNSWVDLSKELKIMSKEILKDISMTSSNILNFENLWSKAITENKKEITVLIDNNIKNVSIEGEKSDYNDPLIVSELSELKNYDYCYDQEILKNMSNTNFDVYSGFWKSPLNNYIDNKNIFTEKKSAFLLTIIRHYIKELQTDNTSNTVIILLGSFCKTKDDNTADRLMTLYSETNNKRIQFYIINRLKILEKTEQDSSSKAILNSFIDKNKI